MKKNWLSSICNPLSILNSFLSRKKIRKKVSFRGQRLYAAVANKDTSVLIERLGPHFNGLNEKDAENRLKKYGPNTLFEARNPLIEAARAFVKTLFNPVILLLVFIAAVSLFTHDKTGAFIVLTMAGASVLVTFLQERRSKRTADNLKEKVTIRAAAWRQSIDEEGKPFRAQQHILFENVVPGDILWLVAGDLIPADVRLLEARDLFVNQSSLTGESMPVEKSAKTLTGPFSLLEAPNLCFASSHVVSGTARALVLRTGRERYIGSIARSLESKKQKTPFEDGVHKFSLLMLRFMIIIVPFVFLLNGFFKNDWTQAFVFAIAVAVGLTPEMLPMILTVNLSKGALNMARKKVIVKHLHAIQNFGAINILCTDKTGTLTQDHVVLERYIDVKDKESESIFETIFINSLYQTGLKNLIDVAILEHATPSLRERVAASYSKIDEIPFDFQRRRMSVVASGLHEGEKKNFLICKGAPEEIYKICAYVQEDGQRVALSEERKKEYMELVYRHNKNGLRILAVATKTFPFQKTRFAVGDEQDLTLLGFISFLDPPKETAKEAIISLQEKGVQVKILTGDNEVVAKKIAELVGIVPTSLTGLDIESMSDSVLQKRVNDVAIFAKLNPLQKQRVVELLQKNGHIVGFMGDGINDAPSLHAADVGISVENGVDIAKETADIILLEKNLLVLKDGILEGRRVFGNILKYIFMGASSNFGNVLSLVGASIFFPFLPILPVQLLVQNMFYDFSQIAIPFDNVDSEYMTQPRRWSMRSIKRFIFAMGPLSSAFDYLTFSWLWFGFGGPQHHLHPALFQTGWFVEGLVSQTLIVHIIRTRKTPFLKSRASWPLAASTILVTIIALALPFSPFGAMLGFEALPLRYFSGLVIIVAAYGFAANHVKDWVFRGIN